MTKLFDKKVEVKKKEFRIGKTPLTDTWVPKENKFAIIDACVLKNESAQPYPINNARDPKRRRV